MNLVKKLMMSAVLLSQQDTKFPIEEKDLGNSVPEYAKHVWKSLKEFVEESLFSVECNWNPKADARVANISVCRAGRDQCLCKFRLTFPTNFPQCAPEVALYTSIPAPLFVTFMKHPIFSSEWNADEKLSRIFLKLFRQLDICHKDLISDISILSGDFLYSKLFPVSFGDVSSIYSLTTNIAVESLITELYGVHINEVQQSYKELIAIEGYIYPDGKSKSSSVRAIANNGKSGAGGIGGVGYSSYSISSTTAPNTRHSKVKILIEKLSTKLAPFLSYQPPGVFAFLRHKAKEAVDIGMSPKLEWILLSPLPELLVLLINECSMEEVYRSLIYVEHLYTITVAVEVVLRNIWKDNYLQDCASKQLAEIVTPMKVANTLDEESSLLPSRNERRNRVKSILAHMYAKLDAIEKMIKTVEERKRALPWIANVKKYSQIYCSKALLAFLPESFYSLTSTSCAPIPCSSSSADTMDTSISASSSAIPPQSSSNQTVAQKQKLFYVEELEKMHYFFKHQSSVLNIPSATSRNSSIEKCPKAWIRELMFIEENIPSDVAIFVSEAHPNYIIVVMSLIANRDSPYYGGTYLFHMCIPEAYPNSPPKVQFITTGEGRVRFNPNLYDSGYVCLSLLGTWSGEPWNPQSSNITQVILSILYLIFTEEPYYNEPGYIMNAREQPVSMSYNYRIMQENLKYAILYHLRKPTTFYGPNIDFYIRNFYEQNWNYGYEIGTHLVQRCLAFCQKFRFNYVILDRTIKEINEFFPAKNSILPTAEYMDLEVKEFDEE